MPASSTPRPQPKHGATPSTSHWGSGQRASHLLAPIPRPVPGKSSQKIGFHRPFVELTPCLTTQHTCRAQIYLPGAGSYFLLFFQRQSCTGDEQSFWALQPRHRNGNQSHSSRDHSTNRFSALQLEQRRTRLLNYHVKKRSSRWCKSEQLVLAWIGCVRGKMSHFVNPCIETSSTVLLEKSRDRPGFKSSLPLKAIMPNKQLLMSHYLFKNRTV